MTKQQPGMRWFRIYSEIKDDPKMLCLSDHQFRLWMGLLCMASEADDRGVIPPYPIAGLAAALRTTTDALEEALDLFAQLDMVARREDGEVELTHFLERQYDNPSDQPAQTRERKRRQRTRDTNESHENVTTESRPSHDTEERRGEEIREEKSINHLRGDADASPSEPESTDVPFSEPPETEQPTPMPAKKPTTAQAIYSVLRDEWGITAGKETKPQRQELNAATKHLGEVGYTPDQVRQACKEYKRRWPNLAFTPSALVKHIHTMLAPPGHANGRTREIVIEPHEEDWVPERPIPLPRKERQDVYTGYG